MQVLSTVPGLGPQPRQLLQPSGFPVPQNLREAAQGRVGLPPTCGVSHTRAHAGLSDSQALSSSLVAWEDLWLTPRSCVASGDVRNQPFRARSV